MAEKFNILVADDTPLMRDLLVGLIRRLGDYEVMAVKDGQAALELCNRPGLNFRVAFLDQNMPGFKGVELVNLIRSSQPGCVTAIVTSQSDPNTVKTAISSGAQGFLVKPYSIGQVEHIINLAKAKG